VAVEETPQSRIDEALRFLNVVCVALLLSVGVFAMVAWFVASGPGASEQVGPPVPDALAYAGVLVGIGLLVAAPFVQRKILERAAVTVRADERTVTALESYRLATLLAFILREGAAIVGLMLALLTGEGMWCYVLSAMALVAMIWGWPRQEQLAQLLGGELAT
jgi:hypothetical protein